MPVTIQFDKQRELTFGLRAVQDLEEQMGGTPLLTVVRQMALGGVTAIVNGLWAGLKHEDKTLNPNLVTKMLEAYLAKGGRLRPLADALAKAIEETNLFTTDEDDEEAEGNAKPEPVATGL